MKTISEAKVRTAVCSVFLLISVSAFADDTSDIRDLLNSFLDGVTQEAIHDRFWAHDLIYTSSRGTRTTKADIMAGFEGVEAGGNSGGPAYSAEDVQIQVYDDTAVVAFRLVASPEGGSSRQEYLNTGTFLKRENEWRVIAWQATIIPETIIPAQ